MKIIRVNEIENVKIGHAQKEEAGTGCTVILCEKGAPTGVDIRGGGPASRETQLLDPVAANQGIHGILLSGGSAFGLDAAGGVMEYLEEKNVGFDVGVTKVPIVCSSCIFDLVVGDVHVRPDKRMGYDACLDAEKNVHREGNVGAGTGASVGKFLGFDQAMKSGLGTYAIQIGDLKIGAVVVVNALGDIFDMDTGKKIAGLRNKEQNDFLDTQEEMCKSYEGTKDLFTGNTTIGAVITNGKFNKVEMKKIASMAQNGYAKAIRPVHTTADGDSIYAMSVGEVRADLNVVGSLAAEVMAKAIRSAVQNAASAFGLKAAKDL